jgi:hypothetical protein
MACVRQGSGGAGHNLAALTAHCLYSLHHMACPCADRNGPHDDLAVAGRCESDRHQSVDNVGRSLPSSNRAALDLAGCGTPRHDAGCYVARPYSGGDHAGHDLASQRSSH